MLLMVRFHTGSCDQISRWVGRSWICCTHIALVDLLFGHCEDAAVEALPVVTFEIFVRNARVAILGAHDAMVSWVKVELDDVSNSRLGCVRAYLMI